MDLGSPSRARAERGSGRGLGNSETPFPGRTKTQPLTQLAMKQGSDTKTPASTKRPTKTPAKGSSSKQRKRYLVELKLE